MEIDRAPQSRCQSIGPWVFQHLGASLLLTGHNAGNSLPLFRTYFATYFSCKSLCIKFLRLYRFFRLGNPRP